VPRTGWPDEFVKNRPKCSPTYFSLKFSDNLKRAKIAQKCGQVFLIFKKSNPSPNGKRLTQSGHPGPSHLM
jgi:hypothetical protein